MEINNKILIAIVVAIIIAIIYVKNAKDDVSRYKNIIDKFMTDKPQKKILKNVKFDIK